MHVVAGKRRQRLDPGGGLCLCPSFSFSGDVPHGPAPAPHHPCPRTPLILQTSAPKSHVQGSLPKPHHYRSSHATLQSHHLSSVTCTRVPVSVHDYWLPEAPSAHPNLTTPAMRQKLNTYAVSGILKTPSQLMFSEHLPCASSL